MPIPPVVIDLAVRGMTDVSRAFETVDQRIARFEKQQARGAEQGARARVRTSREEAMGRERAYAKLFDTIERNEKRSVAAAEKAEKAKGRASEKATALAVRESKKAADAEIAQQRRIEAEKERSYRRMTASLEREAARQAAAETRAFERARHERGAIGRRVGGIVTGSVGGLFHGAANVAGVMLGFGGGMALADAARRQMSAQRSAALLVNQVTTGGRAPAGANVASILGQASQVATSLGIDKTDVIEGTRAYAKTARGGDFAGAMANMGFFAKVAKANDIDMRDVASAAGMLQSQNPDLAKDPARMRQMILDISAQSKAGSLGMGEIISQAGVLGSVRGFIAGDQTTNQRKLLALGQIVAPDAPGEAGTMIKDLFQEAAKPKHMAALKQLGVKFDQQGRVSSIEDLIGKAMVGTKGDLGKLGELFAGRGETLFRSLQPTFLNAGGGNAGEAAVQSVISGVTGATMSEKDLDAQVAQVMSTPAAKFDQAIERIRDTLEQKLEPYLERFADKLPELLPKIDAIIDEAAKFADWFADNPIKGVGAIVLAAVAKDLATAGIGAGVKVILERILAASLAGSAGSGAAGNAASGVAASGAAGAAGRVLGRAAPYIGNAGLVVGAGILAGSLATWEIDAGVDAKNDAHRKALIGTASGGAMAAYLTRETLNGTVDANDIEIAKKRRDTLNALIVEQNKASQPSHLQTVAEGMAQVEQGAANLFGSKTTFADDMIAKRVQEQGRATQDATKTMAELTLAINAAEKAMKRFGQTASNTAPSSPARNGPIAGFGNLR